MTSMRLDMSQNLKMLQQMKLAPRMIQSMQILALPVMELEERIRTEAVENPVLELGASNNETNSTDLEVQFGTEFDPGVNGEAPTAAPMGPMSKQEARLANHREQFERQYQEFDDNYVPDHKPSRLAGIELSDRKQEAMANMADRPQALVGHLLEQLPLFEASAKIKRFVAHLIGNLNERGYLPAPAADLALDFNEPLTPAEIDAGVRLLHQLDPPGIGARDLRERWLLQLDAAETDLEYSDVARELVQSHWDDLTHKRWPAIERKTGYDAETLQAALHDLQKLDPNPAARFNDVKTQYVVPDCTVERDEKGEWDVRINNEHTPNVSLSPQYVEMIKQKQGDEKAREFLKRKYTQARWLIDAIEQRNNTLTKVARAIIDHQKDFLEKGPEHIEPLKMQQIADRVGVHVTTVSRAVDDKWVQTPRGILPLKRFFGGGTVTADGKEIAYDTIKRRLTEIIDHEDKTNPLSDDEIVAKFTQAGIPLARRTVTKYRKMLNIPSSRDRRQAK